MPTIRLATDDDMRAIDSRNLDRIDDLPHLYIPVAAVDIPLPTQGVPPDPIDLMRTWGVAHERTVPDYVRLFPGSLIAARNFGQFVERAELLYHGAEAAELFVSAS